MPSTPARTCIPKTCIHVKTNGVLCGSPALRDSIKCYFHHKHRRLKRQSVGSSLGSPRERLRALAQILHAVENHRMDAEVARTLLYGIQLTS